MSNLRRMVQIYVWQKGYYPLDQFMEKSKQELENSFAVFNNLSCNRVNDKKSERKLYPRKVKE